MFHLNCDMFLVYVALLLMRIVNIFKDFGQLIYFRWKILSVIINILLICSLTLCFLLPILPCRHAVGKTFFVQDCNILFHDLLVSNIIILWLKFLYLTLIFHFANLMCKSLVWRFCLHTVLICFHDICQ